MKIAIDKDKLTVRIAIENDRDLSDAQAIDRLTSSKDWKVLMNAHIFVREAMLEGVKSVTSSEASFRMAGIKAGAFKGFDEALSITQKIKEAADLYRKNKSADLQEAYDEGSDSALNGN